MTTTSFTYSSQPHPAPKNTSSKTLPGTLTIMSDPRVVRGNTHSIAKKVSKYKQTMGGSASLDARAMLEKSKTFALSEPEINPTYFYEVKPFAGPDIDVSSHLIARDDYNAVVKKEIQSQTDKFYEREPTEKYVPRKTGVDKHTQVEDVRDLFDFDVEVIPILEVIVAKTLEQSLYEVQSEAELLCLEEEEANFHKVMDLEEQWIKQREQEQVKEYEIMRREMLALEKAKWEETETKVKIAALSMANQILPSAVESILDDMFSKKLWKVPEEVMAESQIVPAMLTNAQKKLQAYASARTMVDDLALAAEAKYHELTQR